MLVGTAIVAGIATAPAHAAFPGQNGKIVYDRTQPGLTSEIFSVNPDGTGDTRLTNSPFRIENYAAHWSANGQRIIFNSQGPNGGSNADVVFMNADGSGVDNVTHSDTWEGDPAWSPDGWRYAFVREDATGNEQVFTIGLDGTDERQVTTAGISNRRPVWSPNVDRIAYEQDGDVYVSDIDGTDAVDVTNNPAYDGQPDWSPDGRKLVFQSSRSSQGEIYTIDANGQNVTRLTTGGGTDPAWSPDGTKIVFEGNLDGAGWSLYIMNADGSNPTRIPNVAPVAQRPDWQPLPVETAAPYARPKGATPFRASLVPAFLGCTNPNRTHGAPLAFGSCTPPAPFSPVTIGTGDGNPAPAKGIGSLRIDTQPGTPGPPDEADVILRFKVTNVMEYPDLSDYTGLLRVAAMVRRTDLDSGVAATTQDFRLVFDVQCAATADTTVGSTCQLTTTADALRFGSVLEGNRTIWELGQVRVYDGGPEDGDVTTDYDNQPVLVSGVFVP